MGWQSVVWHESATRLDYVSEYLSVGAMPGVVRSEVALDERLQRTLSQCLLLFDRQRLRQRVADHVRLVAALLTKLLQRGCTPLPTLGIEHAVLAEHGWLARVDNLEEGKVEMGWEFKAGHRLDLDSSALLARVTYRDDFEFERSLRGRSDAHTTLISSELEHHFLTDWVPKNLGPSAGHWFTPQAPLDLLLESGGMDESGDRRIDFLYCHPGDPPLAIEIDGPEHAASRHVDAERDRSLASLGIKVIRITNAEMKSGTGTSLESIRQAYAHAHKRVRAALESAKGSEDCEQCASILLDCATAVKVQLAVTKALAYGWLHPEKRWEITLVGAGAVAVAGVMDLLLLLTAYDVLYGGTSVPPKCVIYGEDGTRLECFRSAKEDSRDGAGQSAPDLCDKLRIDAERHLSPFHCLPRKPAADIVVRSVFLPVAFAKEPVTDLPRPSVALESYDGAHAALRFFLRTIFRKYEFRSMQGESVFTTLRRIDCVVLLPTGAGKSIIYQLAGLLMPGVTLVVDPIKALMDDQLAGLRQYGIDAAARIVGGIGAGRWRERALVQQRVERGEYYFVLISPERLQIRTFRDALRALKQVLPVNLAVIDEAHCVSEWGHDFRPSYLHLALNLQSTGEDKYGESPSILALTGTASRAVLRDMLVDMNIDQGTPDALVRPESFDRKELTFEVVRSTPQNFEADLRGTLIALPGRFGLPKAELYRPAGRKTNAGIVFVQTVGGSNGIARTNDVVKAVTQASVRMYSGKPPKGLDRNRWEDIKVQNAKAFRANDISIFVSTKAYGMGIDKANIRYTIHYGMPLSLESFYQEAGRAGRDRRQAHCLVIFNEYDKERTDQLLDPALDLNAVRAKYERDKNDWDTKDDIMRALFFHLKSFGGKDKEIRDLDKVLATLGDLTSKRTLELPFGEGKEARERALYRLLRIGIIEDYEVDWGGSKFVIVVSRFSYERCKTSLLEYVYGAQPARGMAIEQELQGRHLADPVEAARMLGRVLVKFTYDVIERSRRRMIQESIQLARHAKSDGDVRSRILDYLQEGLGAERMEELIDEKEVDLREWLGMAEKVQTAIDAGELRGLSIRFLESYPDHPGLFMSRAVAETMCPNPDVTLVANDLAAFVRLSVDRYRLSRSDMIAALGTLCDLAATRAKRLQLPLVVAMDKLARAERRWSFAHEVMQARETDLTERDAHIARLIQRDHQLTLRLKRIARRWTNPSQAFRLRQKLKGQRNDTSSGSRKSHRRKPRTRSRPDRSA